MNNSTLSTDSAQDDNPQTRVAKTIIRVKHDAGNPYFLMLRKTAQNKQLSYEALGLLAYLLSQPDDWHISITDLKRQKCGRDKAYHLLDELITARHAERVITRGKKAKFASVEYVIHESPLPEKPYTVNTDAYIVENTQNINTCDASKSDASGVSADASGETTTVQGETAHTPDNSDDGIEASETTIAPAPRPRNLLYDAVAEHVFGIAPAESNGEGGRIGRISAWLDGKTDGIKNGKNKVRVGFISKPALPEHVKRFADDWKRTNPNASAPRDFEKFVEHWRAWASALAKQHQQAQAVHVAQPVANALTPEQRGKMLEELRAERERLKASL